MSEELKPGPNVMLVMSGKGKELQTLLRRELNVPAICTWFEVRFDRDDGVVRVTCQYMPLDEP